MSFLSQAIPRSRPAVSATSFARLAAGDVHCPFRCWFESHYLYDRLPGDFNRSVWGAEHALLERATAAELKEKGCTIYVESQNAFSVLTKSGAVISGRADLVAMRGDTAMVIDCKTGKYRYYHGLQVTLYMYMLRHHQLEHPAHSCGRILGRVVYERHVTDIPATASQRIPGLMKRYMPLLISDTAPPPTPSYAECRFCDISKALCPERIETEPPPSSTDLF